MELRRDNPMLNQLSHRCAVDQTFQKTSSFTNFQKNMKQRGDDYGSTLSLLNVQNGHLLLPLTCVLSIFEDEKRSYSSNLVCFLLMNAMQAVHKLLVLRHRYQSSICSVKTQIFIFLGSKPMERRKKFNCFF